MADGQIDVAARAYYEWATMNEAWARARAEGGVMDERVEIMADTWVEGADRVQNARLKLRALEAAGYTVAKLEQVGWFGFDGREDDPADWLPLGEGPITEENWQSVKHRPVYRIVEGE